MINKRLQNHDFDGLLISSPAHIAYLTNYFGFSQTEREAFLLITKQTNYLITDARYTQQAQSVASSFVVIERSAQIALQAVVQIISSKEKLKTVGFEEDNLTVAEYNLVKKNFSTLLPTNLRTLRQIKSPKEIAAIQKACQIGDKAFQHIQRYIQKGQTEKQIADELENFIRAQKAEPSFATIVAFGFHAAVPHHYTSITKLKTNQFILLDFGVKQQNYCSDMTRTIYFGKPTQEDKNIYQTVLLAQQKAVRFIYKQLKDKKEILASDVDQVARDYILSQNYPSLPHSLGHGIGIQIHEAPTLSSTSHDKLVEGMVFSIEPGIYLNNKCGVRIEDLYTIQQEKLVQLTKADQKLLTIPLFTDKY